VGAKSALSSGIKETYSGFIWEPEKGLAKTMNSHGSKRIDTTLGELIAAASEVAFEYSDNDKEAYRLARLALIEILKKASHPIDLEEQFGFPLRGSHYLH
jgi:hypothetical protein